ARRDGPAARGRGTGIGRARGRTRNRKHALSTRRAIMQIVDAPIVIMFGIYIVGMLLIEWFGYRATHDLSDYILGGRRLGSFVTALAAGASDMSGWLLMGLPGAVYLAGISESWIAIGLILGAYLN